MESDLDSKLILYNIGRAEYFFLTICAVLCLADVGSDVWLGGTFMFEGEFGYGVFTLVFVVGPALLVNLYISGSKALWREDLKRSVCNIVWIVPYLAVNLEPVRRYYRNMRRVSVFREARRKADVQAQLRYWGEFTSECDTASNMRGWEAQLEAVPQILLQLYIMFSSGDASALQLITLGTSLLGYSASMYTSCKIDNLLEGLRISKIKLVLTAAAVSIPLGCRAVALASFAAANLPVSLCALCLHWSSISVWMWCSEYNKDMSKIWDSVIAGLLYTMTTPTRTTRESLVCECTWLLEDVLLLVGCAWTLAWIGSLMHVLIAALAVDIAARCLSCLRQWIFSNTVNFYIEYKCT